MANKIKSSVSTITNALDRNNVNMGVNSSIQYSPSSSTGFYAGSYPKVGGYLIYTNKSNSGPSIYAPKNDSELVTYTTAIAKSLGVSVNTSTALLALSWINSRSDMICINSNYPNIETEGMVLNMDSWYIPSYGRSGENWVDITESQNSGVLLNGTSTDSSKIWSMKFDGVDDYCIIESNVNMNRIYTWSAWVYPSSFDDHSYHTIIAKAYSTGWWFGLYANTGRIQLWVAGAAHVSDGAIEKNKWSHVTATWDEHSVKFYINGESVGTVPESGAYITNTTVPRIGADFSSGQEGPLDYRFTGWISAVQMYAEPLPQELILKNYNNGLSRFVQESNINLQIEPDFVNLYSQGTSRVYDLTTNDNIGYLYNGVSRYGGNFYFDGIDDYIDIPSSTSLQVTGDQTLEFWIKPTNNTGRRNFYAKAYAGEGTITYEPGGSLSYYYGINGTNGANYQGFGSTAALATLNVWYHVVLVRELSTPTKTLKWYINGILDTSTTAAYSAAVAGNLPVTLGTGYAGAYQGYLGLARIYSRALTAEEVQINYNSSKLKYT
jgi:hypothetical protein